MDDGLFGFLRSVYATYFLECLELEIHECRHGPMFVERTREASFWKLAAQALEGPVPSLRLPHITFSHCHGKTRLFGHLSWVPP